MFLLEQCWAVLEKKMGNIRRARELFDAATVANKRHIAAWHGWAVLELKQGNIKKARQLLAKALKFCGGNEYVYQTLAMLEAKANRYEQARYLFQQATKCNPKSCASWLVSFDCPIVGFSIGINFLCNQCEFTQVIFYALVYEGMGTIGDSTRKQACC
jgi:tetratricopeptide (TPR) repeat protein